MTGDIDFAALMEPVAKRVLGEPNAELCTRTELRFGSRGSVAVRISGDGSGTFYDHEASVGGGTLDFIRHKLGKVDGNAFDWLRENHFIADDRAERRIVATYDYRDAGGNLTFQVVRFEPKDFRQRRPDGKGGWIWKMAGAERVPYRLPELLAAPDATVFIPEGEKDVDALRSLGLIVTCNPGGAGKWSAGMSKHLRGRKVVLLPDNDKAGEDHVLDVARKLHGIADSVGIIRLPALPPKGDVSDWIAGGGTADALLRMPVELVDVSASEQEKGEKSDGEAGDTLANKPAGQSRFSEDALALTFAKRHDGALLYVPAWSHWLHWDGIRWARDDTLHVFDQSRTICREAAGRAGQKLKRKLASSGTVSAVERLARCDTRHARSAEVFDRDPWALNTPGGVLDLRTGRMRERRADDLFTKATAVTPADRADCPRWRQFLSEITLGDAEMAAFLQRAIGYSLTGDIREHAFFFLHGPGGNGKGVLLSTVGDVLGDYATVALPSVVTVSPTDQHPTHIAALRGARFVTVPEVEEGRAWAENQIKGLTGGDRISARVMRGDPFEFDPVLKLWVAGNHRPVLRNPDPAMRRRLHLIPMRFVPRCPDKGLRDNLRVEWPAILRWLIDGCLAWQARGLEPPSVVKDATDEYFSEQDSIAAWLAERTEQRKGAELGSRMAFLDWKQFAAARGEEPGTEKRFSGELERYAAKRLTAKGSFFIGLRLLPSETGAW